MKVIDNFEDVELLQLMNEAAVESLYNEIQTYHFDDYGVEGIKEVGKATYEWIKKVIKQVWQFIQNRYFSMKARSKKFTEWVKTELAKLRGVLVGDIIDLESKCREIEDALHKVEGCYEPLQEWLNEIKILKFSEINWVKKFDAKFEENSDGEMSKGANAWNESMLITFININMKKHTEYVQKYSSILNGINELASKSEEDFESGRINDSGYKTITKILQSFTKCYNKIAKLDEMWISKVKSLLEEAQKSSKASNAKPAEAVESIEDIDALVEKLEYELGLEAEDGGKLQRLWNIIRTIWNWILQKLKSSQIRIKKIRSKIKELIKSKNGKPVETVEELINPKAIDELVESYKNLIDVLKSISKSVTVVTPNTVNELKELGEKLKASKAAVSGTDFRKKFHEYVTIEVTGLNRYLVSLDRACGNLEEVRNQLMAVVFEINNKCNKTSIGDAQKGSGSEKDGLEVIMVMNEITKETKGLFRSIDKFEADIQLTLQALAGKENPQIKSGDESIESKLVEAIMEEYGIEGVTSIIRNLSSK